MLKHTVILIPDEESGYFVEVPAHPECFTQGETRAEAMAMPKMRSGCTWSHARRTTNPSPKSHESSLSSSKSRNRWGEKVRLAPN